MRKIYFIPGLGADKRVFQLLNFQQYQLAHIEWITPLPNEPISAYAIRLTEQISEQKPIIAGLSFGGMVAVEIAKCIETEMVILLASAKTRSEIPTYYRMAGKLGLHKLLPDALIRQPSYAANWFFGAENDLDKRELASILTESDPVFVRWAIDQLVHWQNQTIHPHLVHIHGSKDLALPRAFTKDTIVVPGAGHLMTLNRPEDLSRLIEKAIDSK